MKQLFATGALIALLAFPVSSAACSLISCNDKGLEVRRDFVVKVTHGGKPLPGVNVQVTRHATERGNELFSGKTAADGTVRIANLQPGEFWLSSELLGITAGTECFHVGLAPSRKAKKTVTYEWGDLAPATLQIAGKLVDSEPAHGDNPIWNLVHRVDVPISEAKLKLQNPLTGAAYTSLTDLDGRFSFGPIPNGIYVVHIDGETVPSGRAYDAADLLVRLSGTAKASRLLLKHREPGGGSCGGTSLEVQDTPN